jgi:hypothetical protein
MRMGLSRRPLKPEDQGDESQAGVVLRHRGRVRLLDKAVDLFLRQPQRPGRSAPGARGKPGAGRPIEGQRADD